MYQLQYNRRSGLSGVKDWHPMPEGRGAPKPSRKECETVKREYIKTFKKVFGEASRMLELRIVKLQK